MPMLYTEPMKLADYERGRFFLAFRDENTRTQHINLIAPTKRGSRRDGIKEVAAEYEPDDGDFLYLGVPKVLSSLEMYRGKVKMPKGYVLNEHKITPVKIGAQFHVPLSNIDTVRNTEIERYIYYIIRLGRKATMEELKREDIEI